MITPVKEWSTLVKFLGDTIGDHVDHQILKRQFDANQIIGLNFNDGECFALIRLTTEDKEVCIVSLRGKNLAGFVSEISQQAKAAGYKTMRCHTQRTGLLRLIRRTLPGTYQSEVVLKTEL